MAENLSSVSLIANPTLNANPRRYSSQDAGNINRVIGQLRMFLPWKPIRYGQRYLVLGHQGSSSGVNAEFYDHESSAVGPVPETRYEFAAPPEAPSQEYALKEIATHFDVRLISQQLLQSNINFTRFMKRACAFAICNRLENALINGNSLSDPEEFDGLSRLVEIGMGRQINASAGDGLEALDEAMFDIRSRAGRCDLIVMNSRAIRRLLQLQREDGYRPILRQSRKLRGSRIAIYNGVPVCRSDHIPTTTNGTTSVFFLTRGQNGVYGIIPRRRVRLKRGKKRGRIVWRPSGIRFTGVVNSADPTRAYQARLFAACVSETNDGLIELANWNVNG
ncbi:phage major capsid protein [Roseovarius aestuariivivens]|uniref:phage major capsid protein n=1 Tax=Roseovarius aestuariivivens TaxID=1888910 RepID=UPI0010815C6F|nr:phage major capsid protein [Roseovarius aestuariivivens]